MANHREIPHSSILKDRMNYLLESGYMSDCSFEVGDKLFKCHKIILITTSPVFEAMFDGPMTNGSVIKIEDVSPESFEFFLKYIYTNQLQTGSFELIHDFCYLANKYMVSFPHEPCFEFLLSKRDNICKAYELAKLLSFTRLIDQCIEIFRKETDKVLQGSGFLTAQPDTIQVIFGQDELNINSELDLFRAIEKYANHNYINQNLQQIPSLVRDAVKQIRFMRISPKDFSSVVVKSNLLEQEEKLSILCNLCLEEDSIVMPEGFDPKRSTRRVSDPFNHLLLEPKDNNKMIVRNYFDGYESIFSLTLENSGKRNPLSVYLVGIELRTRIGDENFCYNEELDIEVSGLDEINSPFEHKLLQQKALRQICMFNSRIKVEFDSPIKMEPRVSYDITIIPKNTEGHYPFAFLNDPVKIVDGVMISPYDEHGCFIQSIHFKWFEEKIRRYNLKKVIKISC